MSPFFCGRRRDTLTASQKILDTSPTSVSHTIPTVPRETEVSNILASDFRTTVVCSDVLVMPVSRLLPSLIKLLVNGR